MRQRIREIARRDDGMTTAEYAVGTVAACGFGGVLLELLTSDSIMSLLSDVIRNAFSFLF
ncbi:MAG TPA: DUF4244 domain-containing protein [Actinomycetes bacterium]|nr:DUF4244 domain-containing protein [Actinomycetes bacterium]